MTHRPGYGNDEAGIVAVNGQTVWTSPVPLPDNFSPYSSVFQATAQGIAVIRVENDSPVGDKSIFIDDVSFRPIPCRAATLTNPSFELSPGTTTYKYKTPRGWQSGGRVIVVRSRNRPWGRLPAARGNYYISIQNDGAYVQQHLCGLRPNGWYRLNFKMTHRPGYGNDEEGYVTVNGETVWSSPVPMPDTFTAFTAIFQATAQGGAMIRFENDSPAGDKSIFLDDISVATQQCRNTLSNANFESGPRPSGFSYSTPTGWQSGGRVVIVRSRNRPWGRLAAASGNYFISIQNDGAYIQQPLCGLTPNGWYRLNFKMTHRPGYGNNEEGYILVNGETVWRSPVPMPGRFTAYSALFKANDRGLAFIRIENDSPRGDRSIFIDQLSLSRVTSCSTTLVNPNFEVSPGTTTYRYRTPTGWQSGGRVVVVRSRNRPWGRLPAASGNYFMSIQRDGAYLQQPLCGLTPNGWYQLDMKMTHRPGYGNNEDGYVSVNGETVWSSPVPMPGTFTAYSVGFRANDQGGALIRIENDSPSGDRSIFLDNLAVRASACPQARLSNPNFELPPTTSGYTYRTPTGWQSAGGVIIVRSRNGPWGGLPAASGNFFLSIQRDGKYIQQQVCGLTPDGWYQLNFSMTHRPGYGNDEEGYISVNGENVWSSPLPMPGTFTPFSATFKANPHGTALIRIENDSPRGDKSIFLDGLSLQPSSCRSTLVNPSFESAPTTSGYTYRTPTGWQGSGGVVLVRSRNRPWGGLPAPNRNYFVSIQNDGRYIQQELCGLTVGAWYKLDFQMTHRPGYGTNEEGIVAVNGQTVWSSPNPMPNAFTGFYALFQANSHGAAMVRIENDSPAGDRSIFVDNLRVSRVRCTPRQINNANFENGPRPGGFVYQTPRGWQSGSGVVVVKSRNRPWGGLAAASGNYFVSIQGRGKYIQQEVCGLTVGRRYRVSFRMTHRPGYGNDERAVVKINGQIKWRGPRRLPNNFGSYSITFTARSSTAMIRFENDSPRGDKSVFLDNVSWRNL
jgi:hypothetical protein